MVNRSNDEIIACVTYKFRYEVAEEVLRKNGTDADIQRRVMEEFPDSKTNLTRGRFYRRSWELFGHCRGPKIGKALSSR
jgi:hypothetical protein